MTVEENDQTETEKYVEKRFIRQAFQYVENNPDTHRHDGRGFLPETILWRKKEAFSDGVSKHSRSLFEIIQEYTNQMDLQHTNINIKHVWRNALNPPKTSEQLYYRSIFERHFPNADILPRFWMPKYVKANDASARTLVSLYKNNNTNNINTLKTQESKHVQFAEPVITFDGKPSPVIPR
jgi:hypothetical protein